MTREEMLKAKKARINEKSFTGKVWTIDDEQEITIKEYCEYINPAIKEDDIISIHVISKTCKEKKDKKGNLRTFLKVKIESESAYAEFPLSFNGEDHHFKEGDQLDIDTCVIKTETCGDDFNEYVYGELL